MSFTQIPNEAIDRMTEISAGAWRLYCVLARHMNHKTGRCNPSAQTLARVMNMERRHIFRLKKELAEAKWARFDGGDVTALFGFAGDKNVTTSGDNKATAKKVTSDKKVIQQRQKSHQVVAKMSLAYKEEQDERTRLIEQDYTAVAIAPTVGLNRDECYSLFVELRSSIGEYEAPYQNQTADFVHLNKLFKNCERTNWPLTREKFTQAATHYFATPQKVHTLADLATRFSEFYKTAFDKFGKPTGNGAAKPAAYIGATKPIKERQVTTEDLAFMEKYIGDLIAANDLIHLGQEYDEIIKRGGAKAEWEIRCVAYYELHKQTTEVL